MTKGVWNEDELEIREMLIQHFTRSLKLALGKVNNTFRFLRVETPIMNPSAEVGPTLRKETATGSLEASRDILSYSAQVKHKLPLVIWQHGKVFDKGVEKDKLEYHVLFSTTTVASYFPILVECCEQMLLLCGPQTKDLLTINERTFWGGRSIEIVIDLENCLSSYMQTYERHSTDKPHSH